MSEFNVGVEDVIDVEQNRDGGKERLEMINELSLLRGRGLINVKFDVKLEGNLERNQKGDWQDNQIFELESTI